MGSRHEIKARTLFVGGPLGRYLFWLGGEDDRYLKRQDLRGIHEVRLYGFPQKTQRFALRFSVCRRSFANTRRTPSSSGGSSKSAGTEPPGLIYNRHEKTLGDAYDADSGPYTGWTNVPEGDIHTLAEK